MFSHQTILALRPPQVGAPQPLPLLGHFRDEHCARNVMEAKQFLLRCLQRLNSTTFRTPDVILIDAGQRNPEFKIEMERWMETHPQFDSVQIQFPVKPGWFVKRWRRWICREGTSAAAM